MLSVLSKFNLEEDKIRVSNDDIETLEELRLLQFAAKERKVVQKVILIMKKP